MISIFVQGVLHDILVYSFWYHLYYQRLLKHCINETLYGMGTPDVWGNKKELTL